MTPETHLGTPVGAVTRTGPRLKTRESLSPRADCTVVPLVSILVNERHVPHPALGLPDDHETRCVAPLILSGDHLAKLFFEDEPLASFLVTRNTECLSL